MSKSFASLFLCLALCAESHAEADDSAARRAEAKRLSDLGAQAIDRGAFDDALTAFQRAAALYPSPNLRFDIGVALDGLGRTDEAVAAFEAFIDASATPDDARDYALARISALEPQIARLALTVTPPHATVRIDGRPLRLTPGRDLPLLPGSRTVTVALDGYTVERRQIVLTAGQRTELTIGLAPLRPALALTSATSPAPPGRAPPPARHLLRGAAITVGGGAVAALVVAAVFADRTVALDHQVNDPTRGQAYDPALAARGRTYEAVEQAFFVVGGAAAVTSVVLGVLAARRQRGGGAAPSRLAMSASGVSLAF